MRYLYLLFIQLFILQASFGQSNTDPFKNQKQAVLILPQYAAVSGIRIDYERKLKDSNKWLIFSPQVYFSNTNDNFTGFDELRGIGLNLYYKKFLHYSVKENPNGLPRVSLYFSTGPTYQSFSLIDIEQVPVEYTEEDVSYIRFEEGKVKTRINRLGADANFGLQLNFSNFILNPYGGIGLRYSMDEEGNLVDFFNDEWIDFGYSGIILTGGVRLGFFI
ncbi:hypothetical protein R9C00_14250 [Flammeovirgaceae bacterium SG7u.111]|nr:hypothetical protein [Flammeovirgaceae bacterium SG7u.132]WPO38618.1 hypothetical protein R9C00_14250 [Flammeovirgaceae bacterium SG7u.111]